MQIDGDERPLELEPVDWDTLFMTEAYTAARKSKDRSTQVGAAAVSPSRIVRIKGWNGPPRGWNDEDPRNHVRPTKAMLTPHAEHNLICNAAKEGVSTQGCTVYINFHPCSLCACMLVNAGIVGVVAHKEFPGNDGRSETYAEEQKLAREIFSECGVTFRWWSGKPLIDRIRYDGRVHKLPEPGAAPWRDAFAP